MNKSENNAVLFVVVALAMFFDTGNPVYITIAMAVSVAMLFVSIFRIMEQGR